MATDFLTNLIQGLDVTQPVDTTGTDPYTRQALISLGAQLMQPIQPGQTASGQFGQAALGALDVYNKQRLGAQQRAAEAEKFGLEKQKAASLGELQKAQAGYYDRMPQAKAGSSSAEIMNERMETARQTADAEWKYLTQTMEHGELMQRYPGGLAGLVASNYMRLYGKPKDEKELRRLYETMYPKGEPTTQTPAPSTKAPAPPPGSVEEILKQAKAQREQRQQEAQAERVRDEREQLVFKYKERLQPWGGPGVSAAEAEQGIRELAEIYPQLDDRQKRDAQRVITELSNALAGAR